MPQRLHIADLIYANECNRQADCLVSWNDGENFASLGIGHFIWFADNTAPPFEESFPALMVWLKAKQVPFPDWLSPDMPCPWQTKADFSQPKQQPRIAALRALLQNTQAEQASFIMQRLQQALPKILATIQTESDKQHLQQQFERIAASPAGWYVLADYVNFKGEGINLQERYHNQGWGLAQVLLHMQGASVGKQAIHEFVQAATFILQRRVALSPVERHEQRWLAGWKKRLGTYVKG